MKRAFAECKTQCENGIPDEFFKTDRFEITDDEANMPLLGAALPRGWFCTPRSRE